MLLAIDIGNTSTALGVFKGEEMLATWSIATDINRFTDEYATLLFNLLHHQGLSKSDIDEVGLCCVVPPLVGTFKDLFRRYFSILPVVIESGIKTGVRIRMDNPREVGADRIANAAASHHLYGGPLVVVDLGSATTFDTISKEGDYLGGAIAPGIVRASESLFSAAQLYRTQLVVPKRAIGTNTIAAMQSGIIFGYTGLIEGIVTRIQKELGEKARIVATGGYAELIAGETKVFDIINLNLTLIGVRLIYQMNRGA